MCQSFFGVPFKNDALVSPIGIAVCFAVVLHTLDLDFLNTIEVDK